VAPWDTLKTAKDYLEDCYLPCGVRGVAGTAHGTAPTGVRASTFAVLAVAAVGMMAAYSEAKPAAATNGLDLF
jgi:Zn-dependent alcohol dehydrogenase